MDGEDDEDEKGEEEMKLKMKNMEKKNFITNFLPICLHS